MSEIITVKVSHRFRFSAERVYDAWLDAEKVRVWQSMALKKMGLSGELGRVSIDGKVGGEFFFSDMRDGVEMCHWGTYRELVRPTRIAFSWIVGDSNSSDESSVTIDIEPTVEGGCTATITHEMNPKWIEFVSQTENGWSCMMQAIENSLS